MKRFQGYTPIFNCKQNQVNEGMIIAYRSDRFETESVNYTFKLSDLLDQHYNSDICKFLKANPEIYKILTGRPTILQVHISC
jgi:transcription elongation factor